MDVIFEDAHLTVGFATSSPDIPLLVHAHSPAYSISEWIEDNGTSVMKWLLEYGAILFRGFGTKDIEAFRDLTRSVTPQLIEYAGGTSPRLKVDAGIYTSTEYPAQFPITLHNEMSYSCRWPDLIYFYCDTPPAKGGQTPIADSRAVLKLLSDELVSELQSRGVMYARRMFGASSAHASWQWIFQTQERSVVEQFCIERDIAFSWERGDTLVTRETRPAVRVHPITDEAVWFNQAHMWHVSNSPIAIDMKTMRAEDLPMNAYRGDGEPLRVQLLDEIRRAYRASTRMFDWQAGDVLLLDNMLVSHGRMPFTGSRRILVTMGNRPAAVAGLADPAAAGAE